MSSLEATKRPEPEYGSDFIILIIALARNDNMAYYIVFPQNKLPNPTNRNTRNYCFIKLMVPGVSGVPGARARSRAVEENSHVPEHVLIPRQPTEGKTVWGCTVRGCTVTTSYVSARGVQRRPLECTYRYNLQATGLRETCTKISIRIF